MGILKNINYMKRFAAYPCATPNPMVVIELAFEAALPILWEIFTADWLDNALAKSKSKARAGVDGSSPSKPGARPGAPAKRGHGVRLRTQGVLGGITAERLGPNTFLFRLIDVEQRALYYWFLADMATEFQARWTTLMYQKQNCKFGGQCYRQGPFSTIYIDEGTNAAILPRLNAGTVFSGGLSIQQATLGSTGKTIADISVTATADIRQFHSDTPPSAAWLEIRRSDTNEVVSWSPGLGAPLPTGGRRSGATMSIHKGHQNSSYQVVLVNKAANETVAAVNGMLHIAGHFCVTMAPEIPFDVQHILPRLR